MLTASQTTEASRYMEKQTCPRKVIFGHLMMADDTPLHGVPLGRQHRSSPVFGKVALKPRMGTMFVGCQLILLKVPENVESDTLLN
jgi:hypothetical protein